MLIDEALALGQVTDCDASREFANKVKNEVGAKDVTFKSFEGFFVRSCQAHVMSMPATAMLTLRVRHAARDAQ